MDFEVDNSSQHHMESILLLLEEISLLEKGKFDAVISMFSVLNYIIDYEILGRLFKNIYTSLKKDGLFVFDVWNGMAVLNYYIPKKTKVVKARGLAIKRISETKINAEDQSCLVNYKCLPAADDIIPV